MIFIPRPKYRPEAKALANKLCEWLEATTTYAEVRGQKDPEDQKPKWRNFYSHGWALVADESAVSQDMSQVPVRPMKLMLHGNQRVQPGEIITSGNGVKYMLRPDGSIRKI